MKSFVFRALRAFALLFFVSACSKTTLPSSEGGGDSGPVGTVDDSAGFYVKAITSNASVVYDTHKKGDFTKKCVAANTEQIFCLVEGNELDLQMNGVTLQINVPSNMCSYLLESPFTYYSWKPGYGAPAVQIDTGSDGKVGYDSDDDGDIDIIQPAAAVTDGASGEILVATDLNTCPYNYTTSDGPNCCDGTYNLTTRTWDATRLPTPGYNVSKTNNVKWGGSFANCLAGPAMATQPKSKSGYPLDVVHVVEGVGINKAYEIVAPYKANTGVFYLANYFDETQAATYPQGYPRAFYYQYGTDTTTAQPPSEPYYRYQCLTTAHEIKAEILVQIRQWNTADDFALRSTTGNPETGGCETIGTSSYFKNDWYDWLDWQSTSGKFPRASAGSQYRTPCP